MQTTIKMPEAKVRELIEVSRDEASTTATAEHVIETATAPSTESTATTATSATTRSTAESLANARAARAAALINSIATRVTTPISIPAAVLSPDTTRDPSRAVTIEVKAVGSGSEQPGDEKAAVTSPVPISVSDSSASPTGPLSVPVVSVQIPSLELPLINMKKRGLHASPPPAIVTGPESGIPSIVNAPCSAIPISVSDFDVTVDSGVPATSGVRVLRRSTLPAGMRCEALFRVLASMRVELDPIFDVNHLRVIGHEARIVWPKEESSDATGTNTHTINAATDRLDVRLQRRARDLAVAAFNDARQRHNRGGSGGVLFIDIFPNDLLDPELYRQDTALAKVADKVILQLRGPMGIVMEDLVARISVLRFQGFRFAVADIESTPSRLSLLAEIAPEYIKLDSSLTRGVSENNAKRRIVEGLAMMATLLGATPIGEGVTNVDDRSALAEAGCPLVQGPIHSDDLAQPVKEPKSLRRSPAQPTPLTQKYTKPNAGGVQLKRVAAR